MLCRTKTTVDLPEALPREARQAAYDDHTSLEALIVAGPHAVLEDRRQAPPFVLRDASVGGNGVRPEFQGASSKRLRDAAYGHDVSDDRGGRGRAQR